VRTLEAGATQICAITDSGKLLCWGEDSDGEMGDGTAWRVSPVRVLLPPP